MIKKKLLFSLPYLLLVFASCEQSELVQHELTGTLKGNIYTQDEFGRYNNDREGVTILLDGGEFTVSANTDGEGDYQIKDIPSGTYNIIVSKDGYAEKHLQGYQIFGGNEPIYYNTALREITMTTIENISLEMVDGDKLYLKGLLKHNFEIQIGYSFSPSITYFIHTESNPSQDNYLQKGTMYFTVLENSVDVNKKVSVDLSAFSSGSKIYLIACAGPSGFYYDILSNQYKYTGYGKKSNIASITIP